MMMIFYPIYFGLIFISNYQTINALSCKDEGGNRVDYYVVYKPPKEKLERGYYHISRGMLSNMPSYMPEPEPEPKQSEKSSYWNPLSWGGYGSSESKRSTDSKDSISSPTRSTATTEMILSNLDIGDPNSFVGRTFGEVYINPDKFNYIMFSDKKPIGSESSSLNSKGRKLFGRYAHYAKSKGVLAWSTDSVNPRNNRAILFLHSVPEWLPKFSGNSYYWPKSRTSLKRLFSKGPKLSFLDSLNNAHMAVCVNLHFNDIKDVIKLLIISDLQVYEKHIISGDQLERAQEEIHSSSTGQQSNSISKMFTKMLKRKTYADSDLIKNSQTPDGTDFTIYTKPKSRFGDIFKMVSRDKHIDTFDVLSRSYVPKPSSFLNLSHRLKPWCKDGFAKVLAVNIGNTRWASRQDESSWATSAVRRSDLFCFSTLPQAIIGFRQSGSMICIHDLDLKNAFRRAGKELNCKLNV